MSSTQTAARKRLNVTFEPAPERPPGWEHNPSAWRARARVLVLSLVGLAIATYLTLYQLGYFPQVWEPFFGDGSARVLHSAVSRALPVPDASLGALAYAGDLLFELLGGRTRWRSAPWAVIGLVLVSLPAAAGSLLLLALQPLVAHAWCTLCLASALISLAIGGLVVGELLATLQHLERERAAGRLVWRAFWGIDDPS